MLGWIVFTLVCLYILWLLSVDSSPTKQTPINKTTTIVPPVVKNTPAPDNINREKEKGEDEMAKRKKAKAVYIPRIKNVAGSVNNPLDWFIVDRAQATISVAEQIIAEQLDRYEVEWYREIAFEGLKLSDYGYARYDFIVITHKGIHLIEYDSVKWHESKEQLEKDRIKTKFCTDNNIPLIRYNKKDYYHMGKRIEELMKLHKINKKSRK